MLKNYLVVALRNLLKHKAYSAINILGLAIGMACGILIILYIQEELSFDRHHQNHDRIYRLIHANNAKSPAALGPAITDEFPEVVDRVRMRPPFGYWMMRYEDRSFYEDRVYWTDETVFDVFSFPMIQGNPETALDSPGSCVITRSIAEKYFGDEDPLGKLIRADDQFDVTVTGVIEDLPPTSHFQVDFMVSSITLDDQWGPQALKEWFENGWYTFLLLAPETSPEDLEAKLPVFLESRAPKPENAADRSFDYRLQAITDIHLYSNLENEAGGNSNISYIYLLTAIAVFILVIAGINFMNLSTARSAGRAREVGLRKVVGAYRFQLMWQFLGESVLLSLLAGCLALALVYAALPSFNDITGAHLSVAFNSVSIWLGLFALAVIVGLFAGSYPAVFLSSFQPVVVLKGQSKSATGRDTLRRILVMVQFAISIGLIIGSSIVYEQFVFIQNKSLGLEKEQVLVLTGGFRRLSERYEAFSNALFAHPRITNVAGISAMPGRSGRKGYIPTYSVRPSTADDTEQVEVQYAGAGYGIIETLGLKLIAGRGLVGDITPNERGVMLINETAVASLGWTTPEEAIDREIIFSDGDRLQIVGVVEDFHVRSLHQRIQPLTLSLWSYQTNYVGIRIHPEDVSGTVAFIEQTWREMLPAFPFSYTFLEEDFAKLYESEERLGAVFNMFTLIAIFIACLGLFGLSAYATEQRTREIGVRKVLGASIPGVISFTILGFPQIDYLCQPGRLAAGVPGYGAMAAELRLSDRYSAPDFFPGRLPGIAYRSGNRQLSGRARRVAQPGRCAAGRVAQNYETLTIHFFCKLETDFCLTSISFTSSYCSPTGHNSLLFFPFHVQILGPI